MNVTQVTENYLESYPSIRDCIKNKLINYSKLSRQIIKATELKHSDFDAVLVACRRYARKLSQYDIAENKIRRILAESKIEVRNKIAVAVIDKDIFSEDLLDIEKKAKKLRESFYAIEGTKAITLVFSDELLSDIKARFKSSIVRVWQDLALLIIKSPEGLQDTTPGFISSTSGKLSRRGINILEFMSCWSETLLVIDESSIADALAALKDKL